MTHGSLFSGIDGFALAAEWMGWETLFQVEIDPFCQQLLKKNYPQSVIYDDATTFDGTPWRGRVGIICGGDPCQPHSYAGLRNGTSDPRYLWPSMLRIVAEAAPAWVVNENVPGSISNGVLDQKISDLEAIGYTCWPPLVIPSGAFGPTKRDRVWLVAYAEREGLPSRFFQRPGPAAKQLAPVGGNGFENTEWAARDCAPELPLLAYGLSEKLHEPETVALGNAIDPWIAFEIFKAIQQTTL